MPSSGEGTGLSIVKTAVLSDCISCCCGLTACIQKPCLDPSDLKGNNLHYLLKDNSFSDICRISTPSSNLFTRDPFFTQYLDLKFSSRGKNPTSFQECKTCCWQTSFSVPSLPLRMLPLSGTSLGLHFLMRSF